MAEIFYITRGHHDHVDKHIRSMRNLWFPLKAKKKLKDMATGKDIEIETQITIDGQLRPYQLWGFVCPDEFVKPTCASLGIPTNETFFDTKPGEGGGSFRGGFGVQGYLTALRLMLKAQKIPKPDPKNGMLSQPVYREHVNVLGIGWKPDDNIKTSLGEHEGI